MVTDQRNKRDQYAAIVPNQLEAVEAIEAKSIGDETWMKNIEEAVTVLPDMISFLASRLLEEKVFKFVFNKVDMQSPDNEYSFSIKLDKVLRCDPHMKDSEELTKDLNLTDHVFKFVRIIGQMLQAATVMVTNIVYFQYEQVSSS